MQLLASFKASDVEENPPNFDYDSFHPRTAARAVILDGKKVALIKVGLHNYYMVPGGGIEDDDIQGGLAREIVEELGCKIRVTDEIGRTEVFFDRWSKKQLDYCYLAEKLGVNDEVKRTDFEKQEGHEIVWAKNLDEAINLVESAQPSNRDGKLVRARDLLLLQTVKSKEPTTRVQFEYPIRNNPLIKELKTKSKIKLDPTKNDLENAKDIIGYAHGLFTHDGSNTPSANDPLTILKEAQAGESFRCVEYSVLAAGLLWAYGIPARTIGLKTSDVETREYGAGHVVIEFWSNDFRKWIMSDVQAGLIAEYKDIPQSAYELKQHLDHDESAEYAPVAASRFVSGAPYDEKPSYSDWIHEYLYFIDTPASLTLGNEDKSKQQIVMLVPRGAQNPVMFQGIFKMNALYIHNVTDFYPDMRNLH